MTKTFELTTKAGFGMYVDVGLDKLYYTIATENEYKPIEFEITLEDLKRWLRGMGYAVHLEKEEE